MTPEGFLKPCLHSKMGIDLRGALRRGVSEEGLRNLLAEGIQMKPSSHQFLHVTSIQDQRSMNQIGG